MIEPLLHELTEQLELEEIPKKGENGLYPLQLNPELLCFVKELDPGIAFWGKIGPCPKEKKEEFFSLSMKANFLGQGTGGAVIALDEDENFLTLSSVLPYDMNYKIFKDALEDFTNYLDYWKEELVRHENASSNS